jgi:hypothetical protein
MTAVHSMRSLIARLSGSSARLIFTRLKSGTGAPLEICAIVEFGDRHSWVAKRAVQLSSGHVRADRLAGDLLFDSVARWTRSNAVNKNSASSSFVQAFAGFVQSKPAHVSASSGKIVLIAPVLHGSGLSLVTLTARSGSRPSVAPCSDLVATHCQMTVETTQPHSLSESAPSCVVERIGPRGPTRSRAPAMAAAVARRSHASFSALIEAMRAFFIVSQPTVADLLSARSALARLASSRPRARRQGPGRLRPTAPIPSCPW